MLAYVELIRPFNCIMAGIAVFVGALLASPFALSLPTGLIYTLVSAVLIAAAGNAINDYADVEIDKINRRDRPIPSGRVRKELALYVAIALFAAGIALGSLVNHTVAAIAVLNTALLVAYSFYFKHVLLVGNVVISFLVGSTFLFGGAAMGNLTAPFFLAVISMFANLGRELVKKIEDEVGDRWYVLKKIISSFKSPVRFGEREMRFSAAVCMAITIMLSPLPYMTKVMKLPYLELVTVADAIFFVCLFRLISGKKKIEELRDISRLIKVGMFVALVAFLVGAFV